MPTRVAIYIRVSTSMQVDKDSLPMQRKDLIAYSKYILHSDDYVIFEDAGYSGKNTDRPKYQEMMADIRKGLFTHVLVWKIDRISRNLLDFAAMYEELKRLGVVFVSKNEQFDTSSAMGEAMLKIILVFAELERNMTAERVTATMISRASNGLWNGGRVPFGYNYDYETKQFSVNESEAKVVKLIYDKYIETKSLLSTTRYINNMGYRHRSGNPFSLVTIRLILNNMFYVGDYKYNNAKDGCRQKQKKESEWIIVPNHHPAIISREQKKAVDKILSYNRENSRITSVNRNTGNVYVFSKIIRCPVCGKIFRATYDGRRKIPCPRYKCPTFNINRSKCNNPSVSGIIVGEFVFNFLANMLAVQKSGNEIRSINELTSRLLKGATFNDVVSIDSLSASKILQLIRSQSVHGEIYGKDTSPKIIPINNELALLRGKVNKLKRALERLTDLYLFDDTQMSEVDYIAKKSRIESDLEQSEQEIKKIESTSSQISDSDFIHRAGQFIVSKKLDNRNYISFERLIDTVDRNILYDFVHELISEIMILNKHIMSISFKNGLVCHFNYKED